MALTRINPLQLRAVMGRDQWSAPEPFGPVGWRMIAADRTASIIATQTPLPMSPDETEWIHASMTGATDVPSYEDLVRLKRAVWGDNGHAYQCFVPPAEHISIHDTALHIWGRADGARVLPDFGALGTI